MNLKYAYGNTRIDITMNGTTWFFPVKFIRVNTRQDKRSGGVLIAFLVALFTEMCRFPLTIYPLTHFFGIKNFFRPK